MDKSAFSIRRARRDDCPEIMALIRELAAFERAPDEVTVSEEHFEESGFGDRPVWWAFVACASGEAADAAEEAASLSLAAPDVLQHQLPRQEQLSEEGTEAAPAMESPQAMARPGGIPEIPAGNLLQLDEPVSTTIPEPIADAMPLMQAAPACEKVVGFALYYIRYSTWKGQRLYLEDILVTEAWRSKGVGTALMDALVAAAVAEGFAGISLQVLDWNEAAINFYERWGARYDDGWLNAMIEVKS